MRLLAPSRSRNFSRESQLSPADEFIFHDRDVRCRSSRGCRAQPEKEPSKLIERNLSFSGNGFWRSTAGSSAMRCAPSFCQPSVKRPRTNTNQQQKDEAEQHAYIRAGFMQRSPQSILCERDDFGRIYGNRDINEKRYRRRSRNNADQQQRATNNLNHSDKRGHDLRRRNADFHEASDSEGVREQELLHAFGKKDPAHQNSNQQIAFDVRSAQDAFALTIIALSLRNPRSRK